MADQLNRRGILTLGAGMAALGTMGISSQVLAQAAATGQLSIAYPQDIPTWDPNARTFTAGHSVYKSVFDQPLTQATDLKVLPSLITKWGYVDDKGLALGLDFRDDVVFHDGAKMTAEDFKYTFFDRLSAPVPAGARKLDTSFIWRKVSGIEVVSPTRAIMKFSEPMPTAAAWLYFLAGFLVPKDYIEKVGVEQFAKAPIGTGPYKLVEYQQGSRAVLEANDKYWGGTPSIKRVIFEFIRDPTARVAAIESGRVQVAIDVPVREAVRLSSVPNLVTKLDAVTDITILQINPAGAFKDERVRLAAHHAINKQAISKAFFAGAAKPIAVPAAHGTPGYPEDYDFEFSEAKAIALLKDAGFTPEKPVSIKMSTPNGAFPSDFDVARAIVQMWKKVGINCELETIEYSVYQDRLRAGTLADASIASWGNTAGEAEFYGGYLLDPKSIFSAFKSEEMGKLVQPLLVEIDETKRIAGYKVAHRYAAEHGISIPLYQTVKTIVHSKDVAVTIYANGYTLPATYSFKA